MPGHVTSTGSSVGGLLEWADERPFKEFEAVSLESWEARRIATLKSDPRVSFRIGLTLGMAYGTVRAYLSPGWRDAIHPHRRRT